ncbi:MAG: ABC transporter substrate-binding protein [Chloroflexota bacterium]
MRISGKVFVRTLVFTLLSLIAIVPAAAQDETIVVDFYWASAVEGDLPLIFELYAQEFEANNPGIDINSVYTGSYNQTRDTILAEGDEPIVDVAVMLAIDLYSFIEDSYIIPLTPLIDEMEESSEWYDDFFPAFWTNSLDAEGVVWSVPFQRSTPIMFYNANLLAENGFEVPRNNEELIEVAQALTTEDRWGLMVPVAGVFPSWMFQSFAAAYGQALVDDDPTQVYFNTPEVLAAVEFVTRLGMPVEDGGFGVGPMGGSAWGETPQAFTAGQAAMIYHTTGSLTNILQNADFEVGTAFLPSGPATEDGTGYGTPTGGGNLYLFDDGSKTEAEIAAAWEWIKFLSSPEVQSDWGASTGYIAARESAWELDPLASLAEEFPQYAVTRDHLAFATKEFAAYATIDLQNIINTELSRIISGEVALDEAADVLARAQEQMDGILADYR